MIAHIAAISKNNCIGKDGDLPWYIPEDMKHFRHLTEGRAVLMGRKTWESIPEKYRPLPNRKNIVLTKQDDYQVPDEVKIYDNIDDVLSKHSDEIIMVAGGESVYKATMDKAERLYITHVDQEVEGCDAHYPRIRGDEWQEIEREPHDDFTFVTYKRL
ncbi:MAG: dihydrofolate reductase [Candidatus Paceibacteria bacterium]